jgi:predicted HD superfamily hydrolase involved in NAD metabolism
VAVTYEQAHALASERLSAGSLAHSERVAGEAGRLAEIYGVDPGDARLAGILHDLYRDTPHDELVGAAVAAGIPITDVDRAVPYLLHGPVAAAELAEMIPGLSPDVIEAVRSHTYGGTTLSPLAMIVYVADVSEPGRPHDSSALLRSRAGSVSLAELFAAAYAASMHHLIDNRRLIHPATLSTWNDIVLRERA